VLIIRILSSCVGLFGGDCNSEPLYYDLEYITVSGCDNSDIYLSFEETDTMKYEAVAFNILLSADDLYYLTNLKNTNNFGFSQTYAWECVHYYKANQNITDIKITTLFDISNRIPANSDVTGNFLYNTNNNYNKLYTKFNDIKSSVNVTSSNIGCEFYIFYKNAVQNDSAQFVVEISLSDDRVLIDTTNVISIIR
jgi:hypothetical protein